MGTMVPPTLKDYGYFQVELYTLQTAMPISARAFKNHTLHKSSKKFIYKDPPWKMHAPTRKSTSTTCMLHPTCFKSAFSHERLAALWTNCSHNIYKSLTIVQQVQQHVIEEVIEKLSLIEIMTIIEVANSRAICTLIYQKTWPIIQFKAMDQEASSSILISKNS